MPLTPSFRHEIWLDVPVVGCVQQSFWHSLAFQEIADPSQCSGLSYVNKIGWRPTAYNDTPHILHELAVGADALISFNFAPATGLGSGIISYNAQRTPSELPYLGSVTTASSGDPYFRKKYVTGDTSAINHSSDQSSFPPPSISTAVPLDRLAVSADTFTPEDQITFRFSLPQVPESQLMGPGAGIYFPGIPGSDARDPAVGTGQYHALFFLDGTMELREKLADDAGTWKKRFATKWGSRATVPGKSHTVSIKSDAHDDGSGNFFGSVILFEFYDSQSIAATLGNSINEHDAIPTRYIIPQATINQPAASQHIRIDCRRDVSIDCSVSVFKYTSATYVSPTIRFPFEPSNQHGGNNIKIAMPGIFPTGTTATLRLFASPNGSTSWTECTGVGAQVTSNQQIGRAFSIYVGASGGRTFGWQYYRVQVDIAPSSSGRRVPTLQKLSFVRDGVHTTTTPTPVTGGKVLLWSFTGQSSDPSTETAQIIVSDEKHELAAILDNRANVPIQVRTYYDPTDATKFTVTFMGRVIKASRKLHFESRVDNTGKKTSNRYGVYTLICVGEWARLMRAKAKKNYNFAGGSPSDSSKPWMIVEIINALMADAGYFSQQVSIDFTSDQRLFTSGSSTAETNLEVYSPIGPYLVYLITEYLGAFLTLDENATNGGGSTDLLGCWRIKRPAKPSSTGKYRALAAFSTGDAQDAHSPTAPLAYALISDGINTTPTLQPKAILADGPGQSSLVTWVEPPEGNHAIVTGVGIAANNGSVMAVGMGQLSKEAFNWPAADFGQTGPGSDGHPVVDPTNPDYTDGLPEVIYRCDQSLSSETAVIWATRRIEAFSMHSRKHARFEAGWTLVTDPDDSLQIRPRKLKFGDIVLVDGATRIINSATHQSDNRFTDRNSIGAYEVFGVPALQTGDVNDKLYTAVMQRFE